MIPTTFHRFRLHNGLQVVAEEIPWAQSVLISIWIKGGSRLEDPRVAGVSHLVEHLVFKGTRSRKIHQIANGIESVGGYINAMTDKESTCFYARVPSDYQARAIDILTDLVFFPVIRQSDLEKERQVVLDELMGIEDTPDDFINDWFEEILFQGTGLAHPVIGTRETVERIDADACQRLIQSHHNPDAVLITITGKFNRKQLENQLNRYTRDVGRLVNETSPVLAVEWRGPQPKTDPLKKPISQSHLMTGRMGVPVDDRASMVQLLISNCLGGGMSSRLNLRIREKYGFCYNIFSSVNFYSDTSSFSVYAATDPLKMTKLNKLLDHELDQLQTDGISKRELELQKKAMRGNLLINSESLTARHQIMSRTELTLGHFQTFEEQVAEIDDISVDDVRNWLDKHPLNTGLTRVDIIGEG